MAITYPLTLFPGSGLGKQLILQAPDLGKWEVKISIDGVLSTTSVGGGTPTTLKLKAPDATIWLVSVDNAGVLATSSSSGAAEDEWPLDDPAGDSWDLTVTNAGVLQTGLAGSATPRVISKVRFRPRAVVGLSMSPFTLQQQAQEHQGQIWAADISIGQILDGGDAERIIASLLALNGRKGTFYLGDPTKRKPRGTPTGTPVVNGAAQTGQVLLTRGWGVSSIKVLKAGDYIQLGSGVTQRIYRVLKDVDSDALGNASIDIWPRLRESPSDGQALVLNNTAGVWRLDSNEMAYDIDPPADFGFDFSAMEAL